MIPERESGILSNDVIGVRVSRNSPVLFVDGNGLTNGPGDAVLIELFASETPGYDERREIEAVVVIGASQLLRASVGKLAGRAIRPL